MLSRRLRAALVGVAALALLPAPAHAQGDWYIDDFHSEITIQPDSGFDVVETIKVNFEAPHHGIYRQIPVLYDHDPKRDRVYHLDLGSVTDPSGRPWPYETTHVGPYLQVKIGSAAQTLTGVQTYRIAYHVLGAMNAFADHDELYWNVNGGDWAVPTNAVSATVRAPTGSVMQTACYEGKAGSTESCAQSGGGGQNLGFTAQHAFQPGEQLTLVVGLQKGAVATPPVFLQDKPPGLFDLGPGSLIASGLVLVLGLVGIVYIWRRSQQVRALAHQPLVVEFGPPDGVRPAQVGLLVDDSADSRDVTASIVDLAVRGWLTITEVTPAGPGTAPDWKLTWAGKPEEGLQPYEVTILGGLFAGRPEVNVSSLYNSFYTTLAKAEGELYQDGVGRGWYRHVPKAFSLWTGLGCLIVFIGCCGGAFVGFFGYWPVALSLVAVGAALLIVSRLLPKKSMAGMAAYQKTVGFRLYMNTAERYRQQFAEKAEIFTQLLPYAIVFGLVSRWAEAFAGLDTVPSTATWYSGAAPLQAAMLATTLQGFDNHVSSFIASTPAPALSTGGSGGFSGFSGGSSGGGGGGGGGGAW